MLSQNWQGLDWQGLVMSRPKSSVVGFFNLATSVYNTRQIQKMGSGFQSLSDQTNTDSQMMLSGIKTIQDLQIASMAGIYQLQEQLDELSKSSWEILNQLKIADHKEEVLGSLKLFLIAVEEEVQNITRLSDNYIEYASLMAEDLRNLMISSEVNIEKFKRMPSTTDIKWAKLVIDSVEELYISLTNKL